MFYSGFALNTKRIDPLLSNQEHASLFADPTTSDAVAALDRNSSVTLPQNEASLQTTHHSYPAAKRQKNPSSSSPREFTSSQQKLIRSTKRSPLSSVETKIHGGSRRELHLKGRSSSTPTTESPSLLKQGSALKMSPPFLHRKRSYSETSGVALRGKSSERDARAGSGGSTTQQDTHEKKKKSSRNLKISLPTKNSLSSISTIQTPSSATSNLSLPFQVDENMEESPTETQSTPSLSYDTELSLMLEDFISKNGPSMASSSITKVTRFISELREQSVEVQLQNERDKQVKGFVQDTLGSNPEGAPSPKNALHSFRALNAALKFANQLKWQTRKRQARRQELEIDDALCEHLWNHVDSFHSFNVFEFAELCENPLYTMTFFLLSKRWNLIDKLKLKVEPLKKFVSAIEQGYLDNPYHNAVHACDVMQTLHALICSCEPIRKMMQQPIDIFAAIIAALVHDYRHTGKSNAFEIRTSTSRALTYNDRSVLENYHVAECFQLMQQDDMNILKTLSHSEQQYVRKVVIDLVLSTDMTKHFDIMREFENKVLPCFLEDSESSMLDVLRFLMKAADVSNPAKPWEVSKLWTERILEEFFIQGDLEKQLGLSVSSFCDRDDEGCVPKSQVAFINYIVMPLYQLLAKLDRNGGEYSRILDQLKHNFDAWRREVNEE